MSRTITRFTSKALVGAGLFAAAVSFIPTAQAAPWKTGGYDCVADAAGVAGGPAAAAAPLCGPVADMAGVPMLVPGPVAAAAAGVVPVPLVPPVVPPIVPPLVPPIPPVVPPIVPPLVPPIPPVLPPIVPPGPVGAAVAGAPVAAAALPLPAGLPIVDLSGLGGKGAPVGAPPPSAPVSGEPILPGPAG
jgi:hypothetical protein